MKENFDEVKIAGELADVLVPEPVKQKGFKEARMVVFKETLYIMGIYVISGKTTYKIFNQTGEIAYKTCGDCKTLYNIEGFNGPEENKSTYCRGCASDRGKDYKENAKKVEDDTEQIYVEVSILDELSYENQALKDRIIELEAVLNNILNNIKDLIPAE